MMWWSQGGWNIGDWLAMSFMMVFFWGLLIALVLWLVRGNRYTHGPADLAVGDPTQRADVLLAEQFARGEIDEDQFATQRQVLPSAGHRASST
ncbi:SHOCT domain-containing protein [Dermatophilaceae bacterium Sec6.4]